MNTMSLVMCTKCNSDFIIASRDISIHFLISSTLILCFSCFSNRTISTSTIKRNVSLENIER